MNSSSGTYRTPEALASAAAKLSDSSDHSKAADLLQSGLSLWPSHPGLWHNLGLVRHTLGDSQAAIEAFDNAIHAGYASEVSRGLAYEQLGMPEQARRDYLAALAKAPADVEALVELGILELQSDRADLAMSYLQAAADLDPTANWALADVLIALGRDDEVRGALSLAIEAGEVRAYLDRAEIETDTNPAAAMDDFRAAISHNVPWARRQFAIFLDESGDTKAAREIALEAVLAGDRSCYAPLAVIEESTGNLHQAVEYYRLAIAFGDTEYEDDLQHLLITSRSQQD